jgi:hypothetical protein
VDREEHVARFRTDRDRFLRERACGWVADMRRDQGARVQEDARMVLGIDQRR